MTDKSAAREWVKTREFQEQLRRELVELRREEDEVQRRISNHLTSCAEADRMELFWRRQLERELLAEEDGLAALAAGPDESKIEGTRAHFDRYVAGDR